MIIRNNGSNYINQYPIKNKRTPASRNMDVTNNRSNVPNQPVERATSNPSPREVIEHMTGQRTSEPNASFDDHWTWYWSKFGIDASTLNSDSKGDQQLSPEQITHLKEKYDVTNLSKDQEMALLTDLVNMDVLTREQALKSQMAKLQNPEGKMFLSLAGERAEFSQLTSNNLIERLTAMIKDEEYQYFRLTSEYKENADDLKSFIDDHHRILSVISSLQR